MMGGCLFYRNYGMTVDIYKKELTQTYSGSLEENWVLAGDFGINGRIKCAISTFATASFRLQATTEIIGQKYKDLEFLQLHSIERLPNNVKITNILDIKTGMHLFPELEINENPDTWFNNTGATPVFDPFNKLIEFDHTIHRAELQGG